MKVKVGYDYILIRLSENPFLRKVTASGIILAANSEFSQETGDIEKLDQAIGFGIVEAAGPECKNLQEGDGVFYNKRSMTPVPTQIPLFSTSERTIIAYYKKEELNEAFEIYEKEQEAYNKRMKEAMSRLQKESSDKSKAKKEQRQADILSGKIVPKETGPLIKIK